MKKVHPARHFGIFKQIFYTHTPTCGGMLALSGERDFNRHSPPLARNVHLLSEKVRHFVKYLYRQLLLLF